MKFYSNQFEEENKDERVNAPIVQQGAPAYEFEGYTIEINEKIMLTPITSEKNSSNG